ncbi:hypothetical protein LNTAR_05729 [Lentisphaera araneosa HTCC2155]|jgi:hypothetical protein|uniref:Uncharacterized protein n=1 Tax=Lentisphaera araneosa HTCC2155 TaxID=313628 RepID=A6DPF4_9BACT|nr:hypothetical protein LNTAR_05729 [Lentisphaera araneosa HTCC2155]
MTLRIDLGGTEKNFQLKINIAHDEAPRGVLNFLASLRKGDQ